MIKTKKILLFLAINLIVVFCGQAEKKQKFLKDTYFRDKAARRDQEVGLNDAEDIVSLYTLNQRNQEIQSLRRLDSSYTFKYTSNSCSKSANTATLTLSGTIDSNDTVTWSSNSIPIKDGNLTADCSMNKITNNSVDASISCTINNVNSSGFTFDQSSLTLNDSSTNVSLILSGLPTSALCADNNNTNNNSSDNSTNDNSTSGNNTSGNNTSGNNTSGNNTSGNNTSGNNTSGNNTSGNNTSDDKNNNSSDTRFPETTDKDRCASYCESCTEFTKCVKCKNGLSTNIDGSCETCMNKFKGCKEGNCTESGCTKCMTAFETDKEGVCDTDKVDKVPPPKFELYGIDSYNLLGKRATFKIYLKIIEGMMFNAKISFNLVSVDARRRSLGTFRGTGVQDGTASGNYSDDSSPSDYFAQFNCMSDDIDVKNTRFQVEDLKLTAYNDKTEEVDIPLSYEKQLKDKYLDECTGDNIAQLCNAGGKMYVFIEKEKSTANSLLSNLKKKRGLAICNPTIEGTVNTLEGISGTTYTLQTSDGQSILCALSKSANVYDATLEITGLKTSEDGSYINTEAGSDYSRKNYLTFQNSSDPNALCSIDDDSSGVSGSKKSSSGGGLSGGAIAGIVIACVAVVAIIGVAVFVFTKGGALIGAGAAAGSYANAPTSLGSMRSTNSP